MVPSNKYTYKAQVHKQFFLILSLHCYSASIAISAAKYTDNIEDALKVKEAPQVDSKFALLKPDEATHQKQLEGYITVDQPVSKFNNFLGHKCAIVCWLY
jgi:hypothetical protein